MDGSQTPLYTTGEAGPLSHLPGFSVLRRPSLSCESMQLKDQGGIQVCRCATVLTHGL